MQWTGIEEVILAWIIKDTGLGKFIDLPQIVQLVGGLSLGPNPEILLLSVLLLCKEFSLTVRRERNFLKWIIDPQLFLVPPKIQRGPKLMKVQAGQRVDISCNAQGTPLPVITWLKDGSAALVDGVRLVSNSDGTLSIDPALLSDAGVYTCVATNMAGSDETEITLHVQGDFWHKKIYVGWGHKAGKSCSVNR